MNPRNLGYRDRPVGDRDVKPENVLRGPCTCMAPFCLMRLLRVHASAFRLEGKPTEAGEEWFAHTVYVQCARCRRWWTRKMVGQFWPQRATEAEALRRPPNRWVDGKWVKP